MANPFQSLDDSFPFLHKGESPEKMVEDLTDYVYQLTDALKYQLRNLDSSNFNTGGLNQIKVDTTATLDQQVKQLIQAGETLRSTVEALDKKIQELTGTVGTNTTAIGDIRGDIRAIRADLNRLLLTVQANGSGGGTIGKKGQELKLVGNVTINGKPVNPA